MRFAFALFCLAVIAASSSSKNLLAYEPSNAASRIEARRELEIAKSELRNYWQFEYPREQRRLNAAIELTELEIRDLKARLREWGVFRRYSTGDPFSITVQETRFCLRDAELRLRDLWAERNALERFKSDQWRVLEWKVFDARLRVAELEENDERTSMTTTDRPAI
jgi:hypothetical protein